MFFEHPAGGLGEGIVGFGYGLRVEPVPVQFSLNQVILVGGIFRIELSGFSVGDGCIIVIVQLAVGFSQLVPQYRLGTRFLQ